MEINKGKWYQENSLIKSKGAEIVEVGQNKY